MQELVGTVFREGLVRADDLPLVLPVLGTDGLPRGSHVHMRLGAIDDITLEVSGTVIERLDLAADVSAADDTEDEEPVAGPIAIAVDVTEGAEPDNASDNPAS
jgi:exoribonuclease-2